MQIYNADIDIDLLEFSDRFGNIRATAGCSFKGKVEFDARIKLLGEIISKYGKETPDKTIGEIYQSDRPFRHHCDRALELNGVNPEWLTEVHLTELLFLHERKPGALVLLNTANNPNSGERSPGEGKMYHQFLGALYNFTQDPEQAFRLAEERSFKEVAGMIQVASSKSQVASKEGGKEVASRKGFSRMQSEVVSKEELKAKSSELKAAQRLRQEAKEEMSDRSRIQLMALREKLRG